MIFYNRFSFKNIVIIGMVCLLAIAFTGCSDKNFGEGMEIISDTTAFNDININESVNSSINIKDNGGKSMLVEKMLNSVKLPEQYLITYEIETNAGTLEYITKAKDAEGKIYFKAASQKLLFVPESGGYLLYHINQDGHASKVSETVYTAKYVDDTTKEFLEYARKSAVQYSGTAKYSGDTEILGRKCKLYKINMKLAIFSQEFIFVVDEETGACVEYRSVTNISKHDVPSAGNFRCIEFLTENIKLPILGDE